MSKRATLHQHPHQRDNGEDSDDSRRRDAHEGEQRTVGGGIRNAATAEARHRMTREVMSFVLSIVVVLLSWCGNVRFLLCLQHTIYSGTYLYRKATNRWKDGYKMVTKWSER